MKIFLLKNYKNWAFQLLLLIKLPFRLLSSLFTTKVASSYGYLFANNIFALSHQLFRKELVLTITGHVENSTIIISTVICGLMCYLKPPRAYWHVFLTCSNIININNPIVLHVHQVISTLFNNRSVVDICRLIGRRENYVGGWFRI